MHISPAVSLRVSLRPPLLPQLDPGWYSAVMSQLESDAAFLSTIGVMDYSLLLGVHYSGGATAATAQQQQAGQGSGRKQAADNAAQALPDGGAGVRGQAAAGAAGSASKAARRFPGATAAVLVAC